VSDRNHAAINLIGALVRERSQGASAPKADADVPRRWFAPIATCCGERGSIATAPTTALVDAIGLVFAMLAARPLPNISAEIVYAPAIIPFGKDPNGGGFRMAIVGAIEFRHAIETLLL
jgi:hypothetical protein